MSDRRIGLIRDLEAHYGRWLRASVISNIGDEAKAAAREPDREFPLKTVAVWHASCLRIALEGAAALNAVRHITDDDTLDIFVRWKTLPNWRKAMEEAGWLFDEERLIWDHPEHGRTISGS